MSKLEFLKMKGLDNDFVIIDTRKNNYQLTSLQISKIANRKNIGCDQLILLHPSQRADISMLIYNANGTEAGACGNATRCVAALLMKEKQASNTTIETAAGLLYCEKHGDLIAVNMGRPKFNWQEIPLAKEINGKDFILNDNPLLSKYRFSVVNMGNPHLVSFIEEDLSDQEFFHLGPLLENHLLFPQKTNVEFAQLIAPNHIKVRVWERGVGETLACGTGACAVAVIAMQKALVDQTKEARISFKGGDLFISWQDSVIMTGGYQLVFYGMIDEKFLA